MSLELLTALASVGTFVVIAATAVAAIIQLHHIRGSNQIAALNEFRETIESREYEEARAAVKELEEQVKDPVVRRELLQDPLPPRLQTSQFAARLFENMGAYVKYGIVQGDVVCDLWGLSIAKAWQRMASSIVVMRRSRGDSWYENFEMLACLSQRWTASHPSAYPRTLPRIAPPDVWAEEDRLGTQTAKSS